MKNIRKIFSILICFCAFFFFQIKNVKANSTPVYWKLSGQRITYLDSTVGVDITRIVFEDTSQVNHVITSFSADLDVSRAMDPPDTVHTYIVGTELYIQFNGTLYLSANSDNLFMGFNELTDIDGLEYVNTSNVVYMNGLFSGDESLQSVDLSHFNTTNVQDMGLVFDGMSSLTTLDLSTFTTNNVTKMNAMFRGVSSLTSLNISHFNTENVDNMSDMFKGMSSLTSLNVGNFNTAKVTDMHSMFEGLSSINSLNVSNFNTAKVTNMHSMFKDISQVSTLNLSNFNTEKVTDMHSMFEGDSALTSLNISTFNTARVTDFNSMFKDLSNMTTLNISSITTPLATNLSNMFYNMSSLTSIDVSSWVTTNVTNMEGLFYNLASISSLSITNFNTSSVTNMSKMFEKLRISSIDVSGLDTARVTNMSYMFANMPNLTLLELGNLNTSAVTNMEGMFYNDPSLSKIFVALLWNTSSVTNSSNMFYNDVSLSVDHSTSYDPNEVDRRYARIDRYNIPGYLSVHWSISSNIYDISYNPWKIDALQNIFDISNVTFTDVTYYYYQAQEIVEVRYGTLILRRFNVIKPILSVTLDQHNAVLIRGRTIDFTEDIYPSDTTYSKVVTYTSSNSSILRVEDANAGIIRGVAAGTATITVTTINGRTDGTNDSHTDTCTIEVIVPIDTFEVNDNVRIIPEDHSVAASNYTYTLNPVIGPWDHTEDDTITWSCEDTSIATIDQNGTITGVSPGSTRIVASLNAGRFLTPQPNEQLLYGYTIYIPIKILIPIDDFWIEESTYTLYIGDVNYESYTLTPGYDPPTGSYEENDSVTWVSDDTSVVTVNPQTGELHAEGSGTATITGTLYKGWTDTSTITVKVLALGLSTPNTPSPPDEIPMEIGETYPIQTSITPSNSDYTHIDWYTNDTNGDVITIDQNGQVTAVNYGHKTVTAILRNGLNRDITITRDVWVKKPIIDFGLEHSDYTLYIGDSDYDHAEVWGVYNYPDYEVDGTLAWTTRNRRITVAAQHNSNGYYGLITAVGKGSSAVTATVTHYGNQFTATANVLVKVLTLTFDITNQEANTTKQMEIGDTFTYQTAYTPSDSDYTEVVWSTDDPNENIIQIDQNGQVTAVGYGTVTVTATLQNGLGRTIPVQRTIKVLKPIIGFGLQSTDYTLYIGDSDYDHVKIRPVYNYPDYEVDGTLEWTASNRRITAEAGEDENGYYGLITAVAKGAAATTAKVTHYGNQFTSTANILVKVLTQSFDITNQEANTVKEIEIGDTFTYQTSIAPSNTDYTEVVWTTDDPNENIIRIDQNGQVTAIGYGTATVTATLQNGLGRTIPVQRTIKVLIPVTSFNITETDIDLYVGDSTYDHATIVPQFSSPYPEVDKTIEWTSSDSTIARVAAGNDGINGIITGLKEGQVTITARVIHYGNQFIDTMTVNVHVLALTFDITNQASNAVKQMEIGDTFTYQTAITPQNSSYTSIAWSTDDPNEDVIRIDQNGQVTAVGYGTKTVTAVLTNGLGRDITVTRDVKVLIPVTSFDVTESSIDLYVGDSTYDHSQLHVQFSQPEPEVDKTIEWTTSNSQVATVSNGVVTGVDEGQVTITARVTHYGNQFTDTITVNVHVLALTFDITNQASNAVKQMEIGDTFTYQTAYTPQNSSYTNITWSTNDTNGDVITINQNGQVTAVGYGTKTVTAVLTNGLGRDITVTRDIKVLVPITSFNITESSETLYIGNSTYDHITLHPEFSQPEPEVDKSITWSSSDNTVATVSNGVVTSVGPGTTTITGLVNHYSNPVFQDTVTIEVKVLALSFDITNQTSNATKEMEIGDEFTYLTSIYPNNSSYTSITWSTDDPNEDVIRIDQNGKVTAIAPGTKTVTAVLTNGLGQDITVTREVKVLIPITGFTVSPTTTTLYRNDPSRKTVLLQTTLSPSNYEVDDEITWTTTNSNIATVSSSGLVTGVGVGTATITGTLYNGMHVDTTVTVEALIEEFLLDNDNDVNIELGGSHRIVTTINPSDATESTVITWSSDDTSIAQVDSSGEVTTVGTGNTTIHGVLGSREVTVTVHVVISITRFEVTPTSVSLVPMGTQQLTKIIEPSNTTESPNVTWSSAQPLIADVSSTGLITANNVGTTTITGTLPSNRTVTVYVTVLKPIESISVSPASATLYKNDSERNTVQLATTILPADAEENKTITWTSTDTSVATVDSNGLVTAVGNGPATIIATLPNGMGNNCNITVESPITSFTITNGTNINMNLSQTHTINTSILPQDTTDDPTITWVSDDATIASVNANGVITAENYGTTTITGTLATNQQVTIRVKVVKPINGVTISQSTLSLARGNNQTDRATLEMNLVPPDATEDYTVSWATDDASVATVDANGLVVATGNGTATITGTLSTLSGNLSDSCVVTVTTPVSSFSIVGSTNINLNKGRTVTLETSILPADASIDPTVTWSSSNTSYATVTAAGVVTGVAPGTAVITGRLSNNMTVQVTVNVIIPITSFSIGPSTIEIMPEGTRTLTTSFSPRNATESKVITWESGDTSIATVDSNGVVTGVAVGETSITGTLQNGMTSTISVVVTLTPSLVKRGDYTKDDVINISDVILGLKKLFGYESILDEDYQIGDLDNNNVLNISDIIILLKYIFGYINSI